MSQLDKQQDKQLDTQHDAQRDEQQDKPDNPAFARLRLVLGDNALKTLNNSCVMVLGIGGVGSNCCEALARGGVGKFILLDRDVVELSNINRQAVAFYSTQGQRKVDVMKKIILDINPACEVQTVFAFLPKDVGSVLDTLPRPDYVVDAIDTISQKLALAQWCQTHQIRQISSMGGANKLDPTHFKFADIHKTAVCPVSKIMRKECRKRNIKHLQVLYSDEVPLPTLRENRQIEATLPQASQTTATQPELPQQAAPSQTPQATPQSKPQPRPEKGSILGTMSYIPPIMGQMLAGKVICDLCGIINNQTGHRKEQ